jgi:hypothetical protein
MDIRYYSRRLLSPFHGVQQVVSIPGGIAESMNGHDWQLYVADERIVSHTGLSEVRYGDWNPSRGRHRSKIRGTLPSGLIEAIGGWLVQVLERMAPKVPFPSADRFECWLLEAGSRRPLALLESAIEGDALRPADAPAWYPGGTAGRGFRSEAGNIDDLTGLIRQAAGRRPSAVWVERSVSGGGIGMDGRNFDVAEFPPLLLQDDWPTEAQRRLVSDYHDWQAPWLLQLELDTELRRRLEQAAWQRPRETGKVFRLFPAICDDAGLTVARVKARMLTEGAQAASVSEPFYPFYNE